MTKIMLVEDDKSLREIYGVRLLAEGYDIVSAGDGEEALAMAIKERPVLIITDVMMPRISGFDMLDILRSTTETKNIKVIMMTALSSEDQRKHGEQLGADRYLVKSQVGIEDVVRVVHEVLGDKPTAAAPAPAPIAPAAAPVPAAPTAATPPAPAAPVNPISAAAARPMATAQPRTMQDVNPAPAPATAGPAPARPVPQPAAGLHTSMPPVKSTTPGAAGSRQRIIQPISDPSKKIDINGLLDKELAREAGVNMNNIAAAPTAQQERAVVADQLKTSLPVTPPVAPLPQQPAPTQIPVQPTQPRPPVAPPPRPQTPPPAPAPRPDSQPPAPTV
jgi:CheY-like chemotaxis protein